MEMDLLYGKTGITVRIPDDVDATTIRKHPMTPLANPSLAVKEALENPLECPALSRLARDKETACILICDITRPVPNGILLPPIVETLNRAGMKDKDILILVATGLHRPNEGDELREIVGSGDIFRRIRIENHFARDREVHVDLGRTSGGIPIMIDRRFLQADLKIVTGLVEPHFMAGYSGGRKVVAPGVAYQDTILHFHTARILEHPKAANCVMEGNPLHEQQCEIVRTIGDIFSVNVVIDESRRVGFVNFGAIEPSHLDAVAFMRKYAEVTVPRKFKTVLTTSAGYPLDKTYYQTIKGMVGVIDIVEAGGTIIIASACSEGMGSREFYRAQKRLCSIGPDRFMAVLEKKEQALVDEWETEMLVKALRLANIQLYADGLSEADFEAACVERVTSLEKAIANSVKAHGDRAIAVVPEGPYVIPLYGGP